MKIEIKHAREVKSSALSVMLSMIAHVALIITFALIFWPISSNPSISFQMQQAVDEMETSLFESNAMSDSMEELVDETVFEPSEMELEIEEEIDMSTDMENFVMSELGNVSDLSAVTAAPRQKPQVSSSLRSGFFGIQATGERIVYVIDISVSMREQSRYRTRYQRAVQHLIYSVKQLEPDQQFFVYCFCFENVPMRIGGTGKFIHPTDENIKLLERWLNSIDLGSGTDPRESLVDALGDNPSCIFLLSDGEFNGVRYKNGFYRGRKTSVELCREKNNQGCPINTIGLEDMNNQADLQQISEDSGGVYQFVPPER